MLTVGLGAVLWPHQGSQGLADTPPGSEATAAPPAVAPPPDPTATPGPEASAPPFTPPRDDQGLLLWVNRERSLPPDYVPPDLVPITGVPVTVQGMLLRRVALGPLRELIEAARAEGLEIVVSSAYRSYQTQAAVHSYWVRVLGEARAVRVSARPGHSEHQLGTTVDLTSPRATYQLTESFADTPEGRWLQANAHRFGFVMSYPPGKEAITGYDYEPWHFRFVGVELATQLHRAGISLEEYFQGIYRP